MPELHCFTKDRMDKGCVGCRYLNRCIPYGDRDMPDYFDTVWDSSIIMGRA